MVEVIQMSKAAVLRPESVHMMVVDDSSVIRKIFTSILSKEEDIQIADMATNGKELLELLAKDNRAQEIDVITLDIEMPIMDGMAVLPEIVRLYPHIRVIMASSLTTKGAAIALQALQKGAIDYVGKPTSSTAFDGQALENFSREIVAKVKTLGRLSKSYRGRVKVVEPVTAIGLSGKPLTTAPAAEIIPTLNRLTPPLRAIAIGSSTGGPNALFSIFSKWRGHQFPVPIFITQHMPAEFTKMLAQQLSNASGVVCKEGEEGEIVKAGVVYIAPGDYHMTVEKDGLKKVIRLNQNTPENFCRPSVDPMVRSLTNVYGTNLLLTMLTGMGSDGVKSAKTLVDARGTVIAQDKASCVVWGMPKAVADAGLCNEILPLDKIADRLLTLSKNYLP